MPCPKCGADNITFSRENQGYDTKGHLNAANPLFFSAWGKRKVKNNNCTIGLCHSCGYTWTPESEKKQSKALYWLVFVLFLPFTLSYWFYTTEDVQMDKGKRIAIIAVIWIALLAVSFLTE